MNRKEVAQSILKSFGKTEIVMDVLEFDQDYVTDEICAKLVTGNNSIIKVNGKLARKIWEASND